MPSFPDAEQPAADADVELLRRLASGDRDALDALYRRHEEYGRRVATAVSGGDPVVADDLLAEAFAAVFRRAASNAPILNFRAYLSACIRNAHFAHLRERARSVPASDEPWLFDSALNDPYLVDGIAAEHAAAALAALPAGWRELLWRVEVEGRSNAELATLMDKSHTAVSSMTHRAREALRRAFLDRHVPEASASACHRTRQQLSRYVRNELSDRAAGRVRSHVSECAECASVLQDLESINRRIGAALWPVLLVGAGPTLPGLLPLVGTSPSTPSTDASSAASGSTTASSSAGPLGALAGASPVAVAGVGIAAAVVIAAGAVGLKLTGTDESGPAAERPAASAPGAADARDPLAPPAAEPPAGPLTRPAGQSSGAKADRSEKDEEEQEQEDRPRSPAPTGTATSTPPPTYDASISSVDKSDVSGQSQSLTFNPQMNTTGPRSGLVLELDITIDSLDDDPTTEPFLWLFAVDQVSGSGWTCRAPNGENVALYVFEPDTTLTCAYEFSGENNPPPLNWDLLLQDADGQVDGVTGSVRASVVGKDDSNAGNNEETF